MARTTRDDLSEARQSFFMGNTLVAAGSVWLADDPVVRTHPAYFRALTVYASDPPKPKAAPKPLPTFRRPTPTRARRATASS
jgi:hypothetical protein